MRVYAICVCVFVCVCACVCVCWGGVVVVVLLHGPVRVLSGFSFRLCTVSTGHQSMAIQLRGVMT